MNLRRISVLVGKELAANAKSFLSVYMIVAPVILSLIVALVFGDLFAETPELGYVDEGNSEFARRIADVDFVRSKAYSSASALADAVEDGAVDVGLVVPVGFDARLTEDDTAQLNLLVWGESVLKDQLILIAMLRDLVTTMAGRDLLVEVDPVLLGEADTLPIQERMLPFMVLMSVVLGGMLIPALSLVEEKQNRTLKALIITPTSLSDVYVAKGVFGVGASIVMATIILIMNQAFGAQPVLLLIVLFIGAIASAACGLIFGSLARDMTTFMAIMKATGILLYAPGLLQIFPEVPDWVSKVFPTYYLIGPVITVTQENGGWSDVAGDVIILFVLTAAAIGGALLAARRVQYQPT